MIPVPYWSFTIPLLNAGEVLSNCKILSQGNCYVKTGLVFFSPLSFTVSGKDNDLYSGIARQNLFLISYRNAGVSAR